MCQPNVVSSQNWAGTASKARLFGADSKYSINHGEATHFGDLPFNIFRRHGDVGPRSPWSVEMTELKVREALVEDLAWAR